MICHFNFAIQLPKVNLNIEDDLDGFVPGI